MSYKARTNYNGMVGAKAAQNIEIRLEQVVTDVLRQSADRCGYEPADYAANLLTHALLGAVTKVDRKVARRLRAEMKLKQLVVDLARKLCPPTKFNKHVTLEVFRTIGASDQLRCIYLQAIGGYSI